VDITALASAIVTALTPYTPYLIEGGKKFAGQAGDVAWKKAQELWGKLVEHFGGDNKFKGKVLSVSAEPENQDEQTLLVKLLVEKLKENPKLADEFFKILGGSEQTVQEVIAERSSWVENIRQEMEGGGKQIIKASDDSVITDVKQSSQK